MKIEHSIIRWLGWIPTGDLGPFTIYHSRRRRTVMFPRSPPRKPPSWWQCLQRNKFAAACGGWAEISTELKSRWGLAAHAARLRITGPNAFLRYTLLADEQLRSRLEQIIGKPLLTDEA